MAKDATASKIVLSELVTYAVSPRELAEGEKD